MCFLTLAVLIILVVTLNWKKCRLFYYSLQFSGPKSLPFIGITFKLLPAINKDLNRTIMQICESQPPVFKSWAANRLYIVNSQPEDLEILLNTFFDKTLIYEFLNYFTGVNILTLPAAKWKGRRKEMNRTFKPRTIASFHDTFVKYAEKLVLKFDEDCGEDRPDLLPELWKCSLDSAIETLLSIEPNALEHHYDVALVSLVRAEEIIMSRFQKFWLLIDSFFRLSDLQKEAVSIVKKMRDFAENIISIKKTQTDDKINMDCFLNYLMDLSDKGKNITEEEVKQELLVMLGEASETTAITMNSVIVLLGLYPEVQDKLYEEILSSSLDNTNDLDYMERVIKETMRLFPVVPFILRSIDKDLKLGSFQYPEGSNLLVPIAYIHQRPDLWPDPLRFDADRFLPEEVAKRHRSAYMPFSFGQRNCIGLKYAMLSMKVTLASIVKNFKIRAVNYRSLEDLEIDWQVVARVKGCIVKFERRSI